MSHLLSNLTAAAVLVHVLLGCCRHHAHPCRSALSAAEHDAHAAECGTGDCGDHATEPEPASGHRHGDDGCAAGPCTFLRTPSDFPAIDLLVQPHDTAAVVAALVAGSAAAPCGREPPSLAAVLCLPLRLHLLNRVLLI